MTPEKTDRRTRESYPYGLNFRLSVTQRAYLAALQEAHGLSVSEAIRLVIDEAIEDSNFPPNVAEILGPVSNAAPRKKGRK